MTFLSYNLTLDNSIEFSFLVPLFPPTPHKLKCLKSIVKTVFPCDQCEYMANYIGNLKRHQRTHNFKEIFLFNCTQCEKQFELKRYLLQHIKTHCQNKTKVEISFKCEGHHLAITLKEDIQMQCRNICIENLIKAHFRLQRSLV